MRVTLDQNEIEKAIITYVGNQGISITGKHVDVTLVAGRAPNGMSATIEISNDDPHVSSTATPRGLTGTTVLEVQSEENKSETEEEIEQKEDRDPNHKPLFGN